MSIKGTIGSTVGVVAGAGLASVALYWLWSRASDGPGWGLGGGGGDGSSILGWGRQSGAGAEEGGDGGTSEAGGGASKDGSGASGGGGGAGNAEQPGAQDGGAGKGGESSEGKGGSGGSGGGGLGGGSGGGVGSGHGAGAANDEGKGGKGEDDGGGASDGQYPGWGGQVVEADLDPPDLSEARLVQVRKTVKDLVTGAVLDPGVSAPDLPGPLHSFNPEHGGLLLFWADVALHYNYSLPPGRLDPENTSHVPWINLWLDILALVAMEEEKLNPGVEYDEPEPKSMVIHGVGASSIAYRSLDTHRIERRGQQRFADPLLRFFSRRTT